jgi:hypothetical protein
LSKVVEAQTVGAGKFSKDELHKMRDLFLVGHPIEVVHVPAILDTIEAFIVQNKQRRAKPATLSLVLLLFSWSLEKRDT